MSIWIKTYFQLLSFFISLDQHGSSRQVELCQKDLESGKKKEKIAAEHLGLNVKNCPYCSRIQGPKPQTSVNNL